MSRLVCTKLANGVDTLLNISTVEVAAPYLIKTTPGVGQPFWYWAAIPPGKVVACDFTNAPIATADPVMNKALMDAITMDPADVLIYAPLP
jgi:hypothetical protein